MAERVKAHTLRIITSGFVALPGDVVTIHETEKFVEIPIPTDTLNDSKGLASEKYIGRGGLGLGTSSSQLEP